MVEPRQKSNRGLKPQNTSDTTVSGSPSSITYSTRSTKTSPIPNDKSIEDGLSMILSQIDEESYEKAIVYDTERILQRHVFPKSFIWNKPRIQLLRSLPRDIEDMPGILCAGAISPFQTKTTNNGPLGFGMFDMGGLRRIDVKGTRAETIITTRPNESPLDSASSFDDNDQQEYPLKCHLNYQAAARRSNDPGIMEFNAYLPPVPLETALLTCQQHNILPHEPWLKYDKTTLDRAKALISAERAEMLARMPFCWARIEKDSIKFKENLSEQEDTETNNFALGYESCLDNVGTLPSDKSELYNATKRRQNRKSKQTKIAQSSFRKWRLSVRVGGVSSRKSLVKKRGSEKVPMHLTASFPKYFQLGKSVSIEMAQKLDEESGFYLGSYDFRASAPHASMSYQAMKTTRKENRAKKMITIGRTRPIWSSFHQAGNNKIVITSDLTGDRQDAVSSKRPLQVSVFVRLNGDLISIPQKDKLKQYPKTDDKFESIINWVEEDVLNGIQNAYNDTPIHIPTLESKTKHAHCTFNPEAYLSEIAEVLKPPVAGKKRKSNDNIQNSSSTNLRMKYDIEDILRYRPPRFNCLPLEDGYIRVVCEKSGYLQPCNVHDLLQSASKSKILNEDVCSVCWSRDDQKKLLKCVQCGLTAHETCCEDKGEYLDATKFTWRCAVCVAASSNSIDITSAQLENTEETEDQFKIPSRKSRRTSRLPTRFTENSQVDNTVIRKSITPSNRNTSNGEEPVNKLRPSPKCVFCPHSGGAMSPLDGDNSNLWAHEICRIWSCRKKIDHSMKNLASSSPTEPTTTPSKFFENDHSPMTNRTKFTPSCSICGKGEISNHSQRGGLIKCAATGCNAYFHPMCATLVTKLRDRYNDKDEKNISTSSASNQQDIEKNIQSDIDLCDDFTLDFMEVRYESIEEKKNSRSGDTLFIVRGVGEKPTNRVQKRIVPVGLCPLHNPNREKSLYGCTPGSKLMSDFMTIPYQT